MGENSNETLDTLGNDSVDAQDPHRLFRILCKLSSFHSPKTIDNPSAGLSICHSGTPVQQRFLEIF